MIPLIGYSDKLSCRAGEDISFMVSSTNAAPYSVQLKRVICADPNPEGPGVIQRDIQASINGVYPSREQYIEPGSYAIIKSNADAEDLHDGSITLTANIFPTLLNGKQQVVLSYKDMRILLNETGCLSASVGDTSVSTDVPLALNTWHCGIEMSYHPATQLLSIRQPSKRTSTQASVIIGHRQLGYLAPITIGASYENGVAKHHFNGKIEAPRIEYGTQQRQLFAQWDFSQSISSTRIVDIGPNQLHGELINMPTRGMTGSTWDASEMCWRHVPKQYAAIHFHEDDIYDFDWEVDFTLSVPTDLPSGIYAAEIKCGEHTDSIPFFVCPPKGERRANLCVLVSTFTYAIYGNHARPDFGPDWQEKVKKWGAYPWSPAEHREYGLSTYNTHADGSGICHASHRRPLLNMRPGYLTFSYDAGSGLRHFQADSHLIAWLHAKGLDYDVITDQELHDEGLDAISNYKAVTTGSHPEYHTAQTLDALLQYRNSGGRLMYLGGNGFYWRIAQHSEQPDMLEIRRGEGGIRAWASEPGEYYNAFDGAYGGLWRRSARPPQQLAGIGFSAQGEFMGSYYERTIAEETPPSATWVFDGIEENILGDFGLSGGGAAGFELDRVDTRLGSPENIEVLASSVGHDESFIVVPEEQLTHITNWPGEPEDRLLRADMVYFTVEGGGEVFATGSITFCGSLPHNNFENNISRLLENVFNRFLR